MSNSSFQFVNQEQIRCAQTVAHLDHVTVCRGFVISGRRSLHKSGCESWSSAWAPDRSFLAWSAGHRMIHLIPWDAKQQKKHDPNDAEGLAGREYHIIECGEIVHAMAFGVCSRNIPKQRWKRQQCDKPMLVLATGHPSGRIKLWNCETGVLLLEIMDHKDIVHDLHFTQDDTLRLASASRDGSVKLWEFDQQGDCNLYLTIKTNSKHAFGCRWSPNRNYVAAVGSFKMASLFRVEGRHVTCRLKLDGHHHDVVHCDFSPDGALLATASYDTHIILWDVDTQTKIAQLGHLYPSPRPIYAGGANDHYVYSVNFSADGSRISSLGEDGFVRVWQFPDLSDPVMIGAVDGGRCCSVSADGQLVAVGTLTGSLTVVSTPRGGVSPLQHLCRAAVRARVATPDLTALPVPAPLHAYLAYRNGWGHGDHNWSMLHWKPKERENWCTDMASLVFCNPRERERENWCKDIGSLVSWKKAVLVLPARAIIRPPLSSRLTLSSAVSTSPIIQPPLSLSWGGMSASEAFIPSSAMKASLPRHGKCRRNL